MLRRFGGIAQCLESAHPDQQIADIVLMLSKASLSSRQYLSNDECLKDRRDNGLCAVLCRTVDLHTGNLFLLITVGSHLDLVFCVRHLYFDKYVAVCHYVI